MRLGGWQRLWILLCFIYLVLIVIVAVFIWPNPQHFLFQKKFYNALSVDSKKKIVSIDHHESSDAQGGNVLLVEMPNKQVIAFDSGYSKEDLQKVSREYWSVLEKEAAIRRNSVLFFSILWWIVPCFLLYMLGFSIGWVFRGFKGSDKAG